MRKTIFWIASAYVVAYPIFLNAQWISAETKGWALAGFILAVVALVVTEAWDKADFKGQLRVITDGIETVDSALEDVVSTGGNGRRSQFEILYRLATNAIVGVASPSRSQAQLFLVHSHEDHDHLVSVCASNGHLKRSRNHFSSIGDESDRVVWKAARENRTIFYKNLSWFRLGKMPPGFSRKGKKRYVTFITTPVKLGDEVLGLLTINSRIPFTLSANDVRLVQAVARKISIGASCSRALQTPRDYAKIKSEPKKGCIP